MIIRPVAEGEFSIVASLHRQSITTGFLSTLGEAFLSELYRGIAAQPGALVVVADSENKVTGFIAGTISTKKLYRNIMLKSLVRFVPHLYKYALNGIVVRRMVETVAYGFRKRATEEPSCRIDAELLSISVLATARGTGTGKRLVGALEVFFRGREIDEYKTVTYSLDEKANNFYRSCSFSFNRSFLHHGNIMNEYVKKL